MLSQIEERVLDNGLKVLIVPNPTSPTATVQVWYKVGSRNERTGITGISHVFEHMMFKGTNRYPKGAFDRVVQENGMSYNAFTSHDFTAYFEIMAADRLEIAFDLESDRMQGLLLEPEEFESEMAVIREERRQTREDPPFGLLSEAVEAATFSVHPYHWPVIGWMSDLETMTLDDLKTYYRDAYRPNNATLIVAGDVNEPTVMELAERYFGKIGQGPEPATLRIVEPRQLGERTVSVRKAVQLPGIIISFRAPGVREPEAKALNILEGILFHGRSSRLYQRLIYRDQLAAGLSGGIYFRSDPSTFAIQAMARPGVAIETLRDAVYEVLDDLKKKVVEDEELRKALNSIETDYIFSQESNYELAQNLGATECRSSWRDHLRFFDDHARIGPEELQRVANETFLETGRTVGYLIPDPGAGGNGSPGGAE